MDNCFTHLKEKIPSAEIKRCEMNDYQSIHSLRKEILDFYPNVNFAIGKPAAELCSSLTLFPFVYTMVLNPRAAGLVDMNGKNKINATGINIIPSPLSQFEELKKYFPKTKMIGTLYSNNSLQIFSKGKEACETLHLGLESMMVNNSDEVTKQFRNLTRKPIDVFWLIFDMNLVNKFNLEYLIQGCQIRQINLLTFNPNHIKMGATIAVYLDYEGLGKQASEIMIRILNGDSASSIPTSESKYTRTSCNENMFHAAKK